MKHYADSSYLLQFLTPDFASAEAISMHRKLGRPAYPFTGLHELEVPNALRLRLFTAGKLASAARKTERKFVADGMRRLKQNLEAGRFYNLTTDWAKTASRGEELSERFTEKLGSRSLDILHVAAAQEMHADVFLTCDRNQAALAKAAGIKVHLVVP